MILRDLVHVSAPSCELEKTTDEAFVDPLSLGDVAHTRRPEARRAAEQRRDP